VRCGGNDGGETAGEFPEGLDGEMQYPAAGTGVKVTPLHVATRQQLRVQRPHIGVGKCRRLRDLVRQTTSPRTRIVRHPRSWIDSESAGSAIAIGLGGLRNRDGTGGEP